MLILFIKNEALGGKQGKLAKCKCNFCIDSYTCF